MLFQTQGFILLFLPAALACYWSVARHPKLRQMALIMISLVFYGLWDVRFLPLLLGQITATWALARLSLSIRQSAPIWLGIVLNLSSLMIFKYLDFLISIIEAGFHLSLPRAALVLPIGISFFSFQLISYLVDVKRGQTPAYRWRELAAFVLLFPHLIAGPIVRHNELIPQFALDPYREGLARRWAAGGVLFIIGLAKKLLLADKLAPLVEMLFSASQTRPLTFGEGWTAALGFSLQLFLDFSAYTEMAIGLALMFGLVFPENFNRPYLATSLQDFWRRWHMSLSLFLRDYLYIPLGGSRHGPLRYVLATMITMGLCGVWHGAGWMFVLWGLWHGLGLCLNRAWKSLGVPLPAGIGWTLTMVFVIIGWVMFRSQTLSSLSTVLLAMSGLGQGAGFLQQPVLLAISGMIALFLPSAHSIRDHWVRPSSLLAWASALLGVYCVLEAGTGAPVQFIYFQF